MERWRDGSCSQALEKLYSEVATQLLQGVAHALTRQRPISALCDRDSRYHHSSFNPPHWVTAPTPPVTSQRHPVFQS